MPRKKTVLDKNIPEKPKKTSAQEQKDYQSKKYIERKLEKHGGDILAALAAETIAGGIPVPTDLSPDETKFYLLIYDDFHKKGISSIDFRRGIVMLAKLYSQEKVLESVVSIQGSTYSAGGIYKAHPAATQLRDTRALMVQVLKEYGQTPASMAKLASVKPPDSSEDTEFAKIGK